MNTKPSLDDIAKHLSCLLGRAERTYDLMARAGDDAFRVGFTSLSLFGGMYKVNRMVTIHCNHGASISKAYTIKSSHDTALSLRGVPHDMGIVMGLYGTTRHRSGFTLDLDHAASVLGTVRDTIICPKYSAEFIWKPVVRGNKYQEVRTHAKKMQDLSHGITAYLSSDGVYAALDVPISNNAWEGSLLELPGTFTIQGDEIVAYKVREKKKNSIGQVVSDPCGQTMTQFPRGPILLKRFRNLYVE